MNYLFVVVVVVVVVCQVHRLLLAAVGDPSVDKLNLLTNKKLRELCDHINKKHRVRIHLCRPS